MMTLPMDDKTAPSETPLTENLQKLADDISVKCGVATVQAAIRIYLRQLAPHAREREGGMLLEKSLEQMERYLTALAESRAECERLREQVYVPGIWRCAKCKMELVASILAVSSSSIHADNRPQECPNNCGPMWRITERDQRKEAQALHEKEFMRAQAAEAREREAYERAAKVCEEVALHARQEGKDRFSCIEDGLTFAAWRIRALSGELREG